MTIYAGGIVVSELLGIDFWYVRWPVMLVIVVVVVLTYFTG
ncbi:MAG TPA: hypothetical protein VFD35_00425 [Pricia sp.]|nr:hypothetical protein [Pricia sp.]